MSTTQMSAEELRRELRWKLMDIGQDVFSVAIDKLCGELIRAHAKHDADDAADLGSLPLWTNEATVKMRKAAA